ncbi:MAG: hypothetical protein ACLTC4_15730 [Hungatella hathewayi]
MSRVLKTGQTVAGGAKVGVYQPQIEVQPSQEQQNGERTIKSELELLSEEKQKILDTARSQAEKFAAGILEEAYSKR